MYKIVISDEFGKPIESFAAEQYFVLAKSDTNFSKAFSHNDFTVQLGLLHFALSEVNSQLLLKKSK